MTGGSLCFASACLLSCDKPRRIEAFLRRECPPRQEPIITFVGYQIRTLRLIGQRLNPTITRREL